MKHIVGKAGLFALAFSVALGASGAEVMKSDSVVKPAASHQAPGSVKGVTNSKAAAVKLVDINSASKAELKTLTRIDDALADKIIAGRPYKSKAFLVTRNIVPAGVYATIQRQIIAKQK